MCARARGHALRCSIWNTCGTHVRAGARWLDGRLVAGLSGILLTLTVSCGIVGAERWQDG
jgi:hypothetical protein